MVYLPQGDGGGSGLQLTPSASLVSMVLLSVPSRAQGWHCAGSVENRTKGWTCRERRLALLLWLLLPDIQGLEGLSSVPGELTSSPPQ